MALAAEIVRFLEANDFSVREAQGIPVVRIVAIKAPAAGHVLELDVLMHTFEFSRCTVHRHPLVALRAGEYPLRKRRRGHEELLRDLLLG